MDWAAVDWARQIDAYCERLTPAFWAEPVNAVTNAGFVLVGAAALTVALRPSRRDSMAAVLAVIVISIGIGSFLFHTFATAWAGLADVLPIAVFILLYLGAALHRFAGLGPWGSGLAALAFVAASGLFTAAAGRLLGAAMNRSEAYLPALFAIVGIGGWLLRRRHPAGRALLAAGGIFVLSIVCRSVDIGMCPAFPLGTHFLWHLFNAAVLGILLAAFLRSGPPGSQPGGIGQRRRIG